MEIERVYDLHYMNGKIVRKHYFSGPVLTLADIVEITGRDRCTPTDWIRTKSLPAKKDADGKWQVKPDDLIEFLRVYRFRKVRGEFYYERSSCTKDGITDRKPTASRSEIGENYN